MSATGSVDVHLMRATLLLGSDPAAAAQLAGAILEQTPGHLEAGLVLASASRRLGHHERVVSVLETLAAARPASAVVQLELGKALAQIGRPTDAINALEHAVTLDARLADAWGELAVLYFAVANDAAGDRAYTRFRQLTPDPAALKDATAALSENRLRASEHLLTRRLQAEPSDVVALRMLAEIASRREHLPEAQRILEACLQQAPGYTQARFDLARVLHLQQQYQQALGHVDRLVAADPHNMEYLNLRVQTLRFTGRNDEAVALMKELAGLRPDSEDTWLHYGHLLREIGEHARSIETYRRALEVQGSSGRAYWHLANLKTFRFEAADLSAMRQLLADASAHIDRTSLEFALGKALEDTAQFDEAFAHYTRANALHRATLAYDAARVEQDVQGAMALYSNRFFLQRAGWGLARRDPIFIVGLPRSGSTLLEQMLGCHSQIEPTRELSDLPAIAAEITASDPNSLPYPQAVADLTREQVARYADKYLSRTQQHRATGKARFVDKMLGNFGHIGLIQLLFPHAAIIDVRRHPYASCFACYKQYFARGMPYSYDLVELARYYRSYAQLLDHWQAVLPGRIHRVYYETLIADPERVLRALCQHCGLAYESGCLRFFESKRVVQTISSEQVRVPLYSDSVHQWKHFGNGLRPLEEILGGLARSYPIVT